MLSYIDIRKNSLQRSDGRVERSESANNGSRPSLHVDEPACTDNTARHLLPDRSDRPRIDYPYRPAIDDGACPARVVDGGLDALLRQRRSAA